MKITNYNTLIFDCDGVILNSNKIKTNAFYKSTIKYGKKYANQLVDYHLKKGGISRFNKFEFFLKNILKQRVEKQELNNLLKSYSDFVFKDLLKCEIASGLENLKLKTSKSKWMIVSGGKQDELISVFKYKKIYNLFDGGIYGSPDDKPTIFQRELKNKNIIFPAIYFGDSKYDYLVSKMVGIDFIFVSNWSEFKDIDSYSEKNNIKSIKELSKMFSICVSTHRNPISVYVLIIVTVSTYSYYSSLYVQATALTQISNSTISVSL